jgi:hypothetical protein
VLIMISVQLAIALICFIILLAILLVLLEPFKLILQIVRFAMYIAQAVNHHTTTVQAVS